MAISRAQWGARGSVPHDPTTKREAFIHHTVTDGPSHSRTLRRQQVHMRELERIHMAQGWDTIGYSFVIFQPHGWVLWPRVYEGRGLRGLPAAQGGHNSGTLAIAIVGNLERERLKRRTRRRLVRILRAWGRGTVNGAGGHRDAPGQATACPGSNAYAQVGQIVGAAGLRRIQ